jgi:hypothetical protein
MSAHRFLTRAVMISAFTACAGSAVADPQLVMVEQPGCVYCERWDAEIAPAYTKTAEGRFAPLVRADLSSGPPDGIEYDRRVVFTPTFVLVDNGEEKARLEGYPGEDFFWPLLSQLLVEHTDFAAD